jgi:hypothetical protein
MRSSGCVCSHPRGENGECQLDFVESTFEWLNTPLILHKSTVEIGTTDR